MQNKKGFSKISTLILVIAVVLVLGGAGYLGLRKDADLNNKNDKEYTSFLKIFSNKIDNSTQIKLEPRTVAFADGSEATYELASQFDLAVAAEGLGKARFIAMSPDKRLFISDMVDWNLSREGRIIILEDFDAETRKFKSKSVYLSGLRGPNSVEFYTDRAGKSWIYIALTEKLIRYPYSPGDKAPTTKPELVTLFPNKQNPTALGIVWHVTRTILFQDNVLYVSVGSGCNVCEEAQGDKRAMILAMDPDGKNQRIYADGLKNAVGIAWAQGALYATENGVDHLGADLPDDVMYKLAEGENYGWPYCYESGGKKHKELSWNWKREPISCENVPLSFASFGPHTAPLGITYFENAHPLIKKAFLVAQHGSHKVEIRNGYNILRVTLDGKQEVFMKGFLGEGEKRFGRPVHIFQYDENSFFFTDDFSGRLYYVYAK